MNNYKNILADKLYESVKSVYKNIENLKCINYEENNEGFYCDYNIPPINPKSFSMIRNRIMENKFEFAFELYKFSGVYEDGNSKKAMLQRIYVIAFPSKLELDNYKKFLEDASKNDHKVLGSKLNLFSSSNEIGQGLTLWHPKGAIIRYMMESFGQKAHLLNDYEWVYSPHIGKKELWEISGHLDFYKDSMYNPISIDDEEYYLKPMNCPFHINIYNSEIHSYKNLPVKYAEYGTVYRYELSGALNGLTRVRGFTQDDAHIICTPEQVENEIIEALKFSLYILKSFGMKKFQPYIATKPKDKFIGDEKQWENATEVLKRAILAIGLDYKIDEGGGAFYGPKIDLKLLDSFNRE